MAPNLSSRYLTPNQLGALQNQLTAILKRLGFASQVAKEGGRAVRKWARSGVEPTPLPTTAGAKAKAAALESEMESLLN